METLYMLCLEDKTTFMEMQKWLLQEKRTQMWENPIDSVNSVYALLLEAEYDLDRPGVYEMGVATIVCTYALEFQATCPSQKLYVENYGVFYFFAFIVFK